MWPHPDVCPYPTHAAVSCYVAITALQNGWPHGAGTTVYASILCILCTFSIMCTLCYTLMAYN